jgi:hypothetical protein
MLAAWPAGFKEVDTHDMCRGTYLYTWGYFLDHLFVYDETKDFATLLPDEIRVSAPTGFLNTSFKTKRAIDMAYYAGYTHVCYAPTDCYIIIPRLMRNLADHDAAGHDYWGFHTYDEWHIGGGSAYWLSRKAMEAVLAFDCYPDYEDRWVGAACRAAGLSAVHDERYRSIEQPYLASAITTHLSTATGKYDPETMRNLHLRVISGATYQAEGLTL